MYKRGIKPHKYRGLELIKRLIFSPGSTFFPVLKDRRGRPQLTCARSVLKHTIMRDNWISLDDVMNSNASRSLRLMAMFSYLDGDES